mmetsp:Transcript_19085/g.44607  ORF Transcript_19085/g.44607 Transcript_19085/m.44607 type:complete len:542 (+) Transcript_19085:105-1730(+)
MTRSSSSKLSLLFGLLLLASLASLFWADEDADLEVEDVVDLDEDTTAQASDAACSSGEAGEGSCKADTDGDAAAAADTATSKRRGSGRPPYWPYKSGNANRTGISQWIAPYRMKEPSWVFEEPDLDNKPFKNQQVFHSSPILDEDFNTYITSTTGFMYSLNKTGHLRWSFQFTFSHPGNPALLDGILYVASMDGIAWAIEAETGKEIWHSRIGICSTLDSHSAVAVNDTVIFPATSMEWNPDVHTADGHEPMCGNEEVVAVSTHDGSVKWRYSITERANTIGYNIAPSIVGKSVIFDDFSGGLFRLNLEDGKELFYVPGPLPGIWSTGGFAVAPNNKVYVARNKNASLGANGRDGFVRCHSAFTGRIVWQRKFDVSVNAGLAVGYVKGHGRRLAVVAAAGNNLAPNKIPWWGRALEGIVLWMYSPKSFVYALDAATGDIIWELELLEPSLQTAGPSANFSCFPAVFGSPSIDGDGTVFVSWSGGYVLGVRDWNGDGKIDNKDPMELSMYKHGWGSNGNVAIGPNYLVVPTCRKIFGFEDTT